MFDKLYQSFPVGASLPEIFGNPVAKVALVPPLRRNRIGILLNLFISHCAQLFLKRSEIQPASPETAIENVLIEKPKGFSLIRHSPRFRRSPNDWQGQKRKSLLVVVNSKSIRARPKVGIHGTPIRVLNQRVESKNVRGLIS